MTDPRNYFIGNYNFSRRVVDHRIPHDFNYSINKPVLSQPWARAIKHKFIGKFLSSFSIYLAVYGVFAAYSLILADAFYREYYKPDYMKSIIFHPRQ